MECCKSQILPHVTPVAEFQCGNLAKEAGSTELNSSFLPGQSFTEDRREIIHNPSNVIAI